MSDAYERSWREPTATRWVKGVLEDMVPKMRDSVIVAQLVPGDGRGDVKFWVELGAAIMLDKPIVAVVVGDRPVAPKLALVADRVLRLPEGVDAQGTDELVSTMRELIEERGL